MSNASQRVWNFALTGSPRSGAAAVASGISGYAGAVCHLGLLSPDRRVRRDAHEAYFGASPAADPEQDPEWFEPGQTNPWHYLNTRVFDNPRNGERAVGVHLHYTTLTDYDLFDLIQSRYAAGDFSVVHVTRNPVACFVSLKQAEHTGRWTRTPGHDYPPPPIRIVPAELTQFVNAHEAVAAKVARACADALVVAYHEVLLNYAATMAEVFDFLELPRRPVLAAPAIRRQRNRPVSERVTNWSEARQLVGSHVRGLMDSEHLL